MSNETYSLGDAMRIVLLKSNDGGVTWIPVEDPTLGSGGSGGMTQEEIQDMLATFIVAGANISATYDDTAGTLTIDVTGLGTAAFEATTAFDAAGAASAAQAAAASYADSLATNYDPAGSAATAQAAAVQRANHTGTQAMSTISDAGALATKSAVASADITDGTIVNVDINAAAAIALSKLATDPLARANHTGTQAASTISDFTEAAQDVVGALLVDGGPLDFTYNDAGNAETATLAAGTVARSMLASALQPEIVSILVSDPNGSAITTGDGKAYYRVPSTLNGLNLTAVAAHVTTVSSSGIPTIQIANVTDAVDMLSTKLTIDASEKDSSTAATAAVINAAVDDVATGDELRIDIDVAGTGAKGLIVELQFS